MEKAIFQTDILVGAIKATLPFCSTDEARKHINRLCVERADKKAVFIATDGHTLCSATVDLDVDSTIKSGVKYALTREECDIILARAKAKPTILEVDLRDEKETNLDEFPPYAQVIPDYSSRKKSAPCVGFNASYLARAEKVVKALGAVPSRGVKLRLGETELEAVRLDVDGSLGKAVIVIMPMRI